MSDEKEEKKKRGFKEDVPALIVAIVIALMIRTFLFQSFYVPSDSMLPTLLVGDHVFVTKFSFGARIPWTGLQLPALREPGRGEIAVFRLGREGRQVFPPDQRPKLPTDAFIKRLVGLPGDTVEVREGRLFLNEREVRTESTGETFTDSTGRAFDVYEEYLGDCRHRILDDPGSPDINMAPRKVPQGRYFFLGDNRDNSLDSRRWGTVDRSAMHGPAGLLYWSWDWNGSWLELANPLTWWRNLTQRTRWGRMGSFVGCEEENA
jgi:signal peptidase I